MMGSTTRRRVYPEPVSCEWSWVYSETKQTRIYRAIGSGTSNDSTSETLSDWERLDYGDERGLDQTRE